MTFISVTNPLVLIATSRIARREDSQDIVKRDRFGIHYLLFIKKRYTNFWYEDSTLWFADLSLVAFLHLHRSGTAQGWNSGMGQSGLEDKPATQGLVPASRPFWIKGYCSLVTLLKRFHLSPRPSCVNQHGILFTQLNIPTYPVPAIRCLKCTWLNFPNRRHRKRESENDFA